MEIGETTGGTWSLQDPREGPWEGLQDHLGGVPAIPLPTPPVLGAPEWPEIDPGMGDGIPSLHAPLSERLAWLDEQWRIGKIKLTKRTRQRLRRALQRQLSNDRRTRRHRTKPHPKVVAAKQRKVDRDKYHRNRERHLALDWLWKRDGIKGRFNQMRMKAKERGVEFKLTIEELNEVLGPLDYDKYRDCIQVRRLDTQRGWTKDNLQVLFWLDGNAENKSFRLEKFKRSEYLVLYPSEDGHP